MTAGEITELLKGWRAGDERALERLTPLVYDEMHRLAQGYMRRERAGHTLQATALVNEAYVRMADQGDVSYQDRIHFIALAARAMKRVLIDHGRKQKSGKRGGDALRVPLENLPELADGADEGSALDIALALERLAESEPTLARIVELRYFGGLTSAEIAGVLEISVPTVTRRWAIARAWLFRELSREESE